MLDKVLFDQIVAFLLPDMSDPDDRKALIESALYGSPALAKINWRGAAHPFTVQLVRTLDTFGEVEPRKPAVSTLLAQIAVAPMSNHFMICWFPGVSAGAVGRP